MMKCPKCDSSIEESSVMCRYCRSRLGGPEPSSAAPAREAALPFPKREEAPAPGRPWEVWVVIGIMVLNMIGTLMQGRIGGLVVSAIIISGLWKQSNGTWWFVTIVNGIAAIVFFCLVSSMGQEMMYSAIGCLVVVGLLVSCRVRGAYIPPDLH